MQQIIMVRLITYLKIFKMTYKEDVKRASSPDTIDYLNARVDALQRRVEFLEAQLEVSKQINFNK